MCVRVSLYVTLCLSPCLSLLPQSLRTAVLQSLPAACSLPFRLCLLPLKTHQNRSFCQIRLSDGHQERELCQILVGFALSVSVSVFVRARVCEGMLWRMYSFLCVKVGRCALPLPEWCVCRVVDVVVACVNLCLCPRLDLRL